MNWPPFVKPSHTTFNAFTCHLMFNVQHFKFQVSAADRALVSLIAHFKSLFFLSDKTYTMKPCEENFENSKEILLLKWEIS
jgi:hypothetical protein